MKKILSIALVALLAASTVFAGISGDASVSLGYDTTSKAYGITNDSGVTAKIELATEEVEKVAEGDIFAGIKATMSLLVATSKEPGKPNLIANSTHGIGLLLSVDEAYVAGSNWKLSILSTKGAPDYAKSAIDTVKTGNVYDDFGYAYKKKYVPVSYSVSAWKAAGVTFTYDGYTVAGGFKGSAVKDAEVFNFNFFVESKAFEFEGGSAQVAAIVATDKDDSKKINAGLSAKASYAQDELSASVAADFGLENFSDLKFKCDTALKVAYNPVTLDVYFKHVGDEDNLLSAKVSASFEKVSGSVYAKDILTEDSRTIGGSVETTIDAFTVDANAEIVLKSKAFSAGANVKYAAEKFTAKAGVEFGMIFGTEKSTYLAASASISSEAIIPGATLSLAYGQDSAYNDVNFLKDQTASVRAAQNFGAITATCKIAF